MNLRPIYRLETKKVFKLGEPIVRRKAAINSTQARGNWQNNLMEETKMRINHNIAALNTYNKLESNQTNTAKSLEKLSSGLRINKAGDDAAGLAISEKMRGQIRGLDQASANASDGISLVKTAEGGLNETHSILQRMRELAVQSANDTNTDADRTQLNKEVEQLSLEITRIGDNTSFNTKSLLNGSADSVDGSITSITNAVVSGTKAGSGVVAGTVISGNVTIVTTNVTGSGSARSGITSTTTTTKVSEIGTKISLQVGADAGQIIDLDIKDMRAIALGVDTAGSGGLSVTTQSGASAAITTINNAITAVSSERATLGSRQNRLEHTINNLSSSSENATAAESRIRDVDMAKEMMEFTKNNILSQAAQSMLAQANQQPQGVLQLLQ